jgi:hypothetical protein
MRPSATSVRGLKLNELDCISRWRCEGCAAGKYSSVSAAVACVPCPQNAFSVGTSAALVLSLLSLLVQKVHILTPEELRARSRLGAPRANGRDTRRTRMLSQFRAATARYVSMGMVQQHRHLQCPPDASSARRGAIPM